MNSEQVKTLISEETLRGVLEKLLPILHKKVSRDEVDQLVSQSRLLEIIDEIIAEGYFDELFMKHIDEDPDRFRGKNAYELAVEQGFTGTLLEWLALHNINPYSIWYLEYSEGRTTLDYLEWMADQLNAHKGDQGEKGNTGDRGKSNYELAIDDGFIGTLTEWLTTIGINSYDFWYRLFQDGKTTLNYSEWIAEQITALKGDKGERGQDGNPGRSNYELAVDDGFEGTLTDWLSTVGINSYDFWMRLYSLGETSLGYTEWIAEQVEALKGAQGKIGPTGSQGKSNYDLAVDDGFEGTLTEWLNTININSYDFWKSLSNQGFTNLSYLEWIAEQIQDLSEYESISETKIKELISENFVIGEIKDGGI